MSTLTPPIEPRTGIAKPKPFTPILTTLGYILSSDRQNVLLVRLDKRPDDLAFGKYNGLGGKMEIYEDALACLRRELWEEAEIHVKQATLRGTISWPGFGKNGEDRFGFVFLVTEYEGEPMSENAEGTLHWTPVSTLLDGQTLNLWPGDRHFLPLVFDDDARPFHGVMPYANGQALSWNWSR